MAAHHRLSFERATIMKAWAMSGIYEAAFGHAFDETDGRYKNAGKDRSEYPIDLSQIAAVEAEIGSFPAFCAWSSDFSRASHFFLFKKLARRQNQQSKVRRERLLKWSTVRAQRRKTLKKNLTTMTPWMRKTNKVMRWTFLKVLKSRGTTELWVAKQAGDTLPEHDELDGEWRALQVASQNVALRARQQLTRQAGTPWGSLRIQNGKHDNTDCLVGVWTTHHRMDPLELLKQHTELKKSAQLASTVEIIFQSDDCFKFTLCVSSYNTWRKENESVVWLSQ